MPAIHIHEDDWGMRSLHPLAALPEIAADVARAAEASERNRAPGGIGWSDVHVIGVPSYSYAESGLRLDAVAAALEAAMPRVRRFTATGMAGFQPGVHDAWGSYQEDAHCYGFEADCFIKVEPAGDLVSAIWFECRTQDQMRIADLRAALVRIDTLCESAVVDYWCEVAGRIRDTAFLNRYLSALAGG